MAAGVGEAGIMQWRSLFCPFPAYQEAKGRDAIYQRSLVLVLHGVVEEMSPR
jgi:hypothetical protein